MSRTTQRLLRLMFERDGRVARVRGAAVLKIYARGDRRTRPIACVERADLDDWVARRIVVLDGRGFRLSDQVVRRIQNGVSLSDIEQQAELLPGTEAPTGRRKTKRLSMIDRLERMRGGDGGTLYDAAQIGAARRFARASHAAGAGRIATSDTQTPRVDGGSRADRAENAAIHRIDAARALRAALAGLDPRVVRVLNQTLGADVPLARVAHNEGWPTGVAEMLLRMGLDHLAAFYGTRAGVRPKVGARKFG